MLLNGHTLAKYRWLQSPSHLELNMGEPKPKWTRSNQESARNTNTGWVILRRAGNSDKNCFPWRFHVSLLFWEKDMKRMVTNTPNKHWIPSPVTSNTGFFKRNLENLRHFKELWLTFTCSFTPTPGKSPWLWVRWHGWVLSPHPLPFLRGEGGRS